MSVTLHQGDCLDVLRTLPDSSVDAIVTDPPAGIAFMGKEWDHHKGGRAQWVAWMSAVAAECLRVLKPGGHALVWALPRTSHWTGTAWEDAGFEARDKVYHAFGSGFPKSLDISKAINREAGATRVVVGVANRKMTNSVLSRAKQAQHGYRPEGEAYANEDSGGLTPPPATPEAAQWEGWGTALKPAVEEWWLFRKPISEATVAANVLRWGTGAINVGACRVGTEGDDRPLKWASPRDGIWSTDSAAKAEATTSTQGRYPAHLIHDGSAEVAGCFPVTTSGGRDKASVAPSENRSMSGMNYPRQRGNISEASTGSAARFFQACAWDADDTEALRLIYCAKASKRDRDEGCEHITETPIAWGNQAQAELKRGNTEFRADGDASKHNKVEQRRNHHPTVKPTGLMRHFARLITPPGGVVLDPFMGSGSTGKGAILEGFAFIGIEQDAAYFAIAQARIDAAANPLRHMEASA